MLALMNLIIDLLLEQWRLGLGFKGWVNDADL